jgi:hypothetical protein
VSRKILVDDDAAQYEMIERRLRRLEQGIPEYVHYVGDAVTGLGVVFQNSWVNFDAAPGPTGRAAFFYKHAGRVYLGGVIKSGASGTIAFQLPVGYRPLLQAPNSDLVVSANSGHANCSISPNGDVFLTNVGASNVTIWAFLEGVSFRHS